MITILWFIKSNQKSKRFGEISDWEDDWFSVVMFGVATFFLDLTLLMVVGGVIYLFNKLI